MDRFRSWWRSCKRLMKIPLPRWGSFLLYVSLTIGVILAINATQQAIDDIEEIRAERIAIEARADLRACTRINETQDILSDMLQAFAALNPPPDFIESGEGMIAVERALRRLEPLDCESLRNHPNGGSR